MRSHTCSINRLDAYLMGDLAASDESDLVSHLDECRECRETLQARAAEDADWSEAEQLLSGMGKLQTLPVDGDPNGRLFRTPLKVSRSVMPRRVRGIHCSAEMALKDFLRLCRTQLLCPCR